jgi:hypothetical protein
VYADPADLLAHLDEVGIRSVADWASPLEDESDQARPDQKSR